MKFVIQYTISEDYVFSVESYRVVEADSKEHIQILFLEQLEKAVNKNYYEFNWLNIDFRVSNYVYKDIFSGLTKWDNLDVMTLEEFGNRNCYKLKKI
jgi:hypothetical protein